VMLFTKSGKTESIYENRSTSTGIIRLYKSI